MASSESTMLSTEKRKIFLSGLFDEVTKECLQEKFKNFGTVEKIKLKSNPTDTTAEVYLTTTQSDIAKCFSTLQNTKWKGKVLSLQLDNGKTDKRKENEGKIDIYDSDKATNKLQSRDLLQISANTQQENTEFTTDVLNSSTSHNLRHVSDLERRLEATNSIWKDDYSHEENVKDKYKLLRGAKIRNEKKIEQPVLTDGHYKNEQKKRTLNTIDSPSKKLASENKKILDNEKRLRSIQTQRESFSNQKNILKNALSHSLDSNSARPKKIIFDDDCESTESPGAKFVSASKKSSYQLFDDEGDETDELFQLKPQFDGPKGHKVFELQSRLGSDPRFQVDEDFVEEDFVGNESHDAEERDKNMEILEKVVGPLKRNNVKKVTFNSMVRYNPLQADHKIYELSEQEPPKKKSKKEKIVNEPTPEPEVSKETYFEIEEGIKERFSSGKSEPFSLMKALGRVEDNDVNEKSKNEESSSTVTEVVAKYEVPKNFFNDDGEIEGEVEPKIKASDKKVNKKIKNVITSSNESFFFKKDDPRLSEGVSFFRCPESSETLRTEWLTKRETVITASKIELKRIKRRKHPVRKLGNKAKKFQHINNRKKSNKY